MNQKYKRLLEGVEFRVDRGDLFGISGKDADELIVLTEIVANIRPYESGKCVLFEIGMMNKKRKKLSHTFYIDSDAMLFNNMTALETLMFTDAKKPGDAIERQTRYLQLLVDVGMKHLALTKLIDFEPDERLLLEFLVAAHTENPLIILNAVEYTFSARNTEILQKLFQYAKTLQKTVVVTTLQANLIGICCDKVLYLLDGKVKFNGTVAQLIRLNDNILYLLKCGDDTIKQLKASMGYYDYDYADGTVYVSKRDREYGHDRFFGDHAKNEIFPDFIKINKGRVQNSFEELLKKNGL